MTRPPGAAHAGICAVCRHHRWTGNTRGSSFLLCEKSVEDPRFPKYPPLPVRGCVGFEPGKTEEQDPPART